MNLKIKATLSIAAISFALTLPSFAQDGNPPASELPPPSTAPIHGKREAMHMVPARVALTQGLNATKMAPGAQFRATLRRSIHLQNGTDLPMGTVLLGTVVVDDMNIAGTSKLALRFTEAVLKNGTTVPVKATIVGAYQPEDVGFRAHPGEEIPDNWNDGTLKVDQIGVLKGVDLHSRISSRNSGVFVSTTDHDVKLPSGSEFVLAIAARPHPEAQ